MKRNITSLSIRINAKRANLPQSIALLLVASFILGMFLTDSTDELIAYLLITIVSGGPAAVWIASGTNGVPVMAGTSILYFIYYGIPILRKSAVLEQYASVEILSAAVTVTLFLVAAGVAWGLVVFGRGHQHRDLTPTLISDRQLERIIAVGLALGIIFFLALYSGWLSELGSFFGFVRSISLTIAAVACFMLGHARAKGSLRGWHWALALAGLGILIVLSWISLFLVGGITFCLGAMLGYTITCRRIPWVFLMVATAAVIVLHAGKDEMRSKYWMKGQNFGGDISVLQAPGIMGEWVGNGVSAITSSEYYESAIDRASLLYLLLHVQRLTPDYIPLLEGESYTYLPEMLVPRFISPDKISSQTAMNMLNVHFGFQTVEGTQKTAMGWGLIAEAYANFGRIGVAGVGFLLGLLTGFVERWSVGAPLISLPGLAAVAVLMQLTNMEGEAAGLMTSLFQSMLAISIYYALSEFFAKQKSRARNAQR
jgi:hypothetical protein